MASGVAAVGREGTAAPSRPFAPSWADTIASLIDRVPGPWWVAYIFLTLLFVAYVVVLSAFSTRGLFGQDPAYFAYGLVQVSPILVYHFLSRGGTGAWNSFRSATDLDDDAAAGKLAELTTTPARPAIVIWTLGVLGYSAVVLAVPSGFDLTGQQPIFVAMRFLTEAFIMAPMAWMAGYLLFRQMRLVSQLHRSVVRVDLLQPSPLHALARLTARSAIVLLALQLVVLFPLPNVSANARMILTLAVVPFMVIPAAAFFVPLRGMHQLLEKERRRRLGDASSRIDATIASLHEVVDSESSATGDAESARLAQVRFDGLNKALASLLQEREFIAKQSTWPWDTTTFRAVLTALALPIVLFLVTRALERFVL